MELSLSLALWPCGPFTRGTDVFSLHSLSFVSIRDETVFAYPGRPASKRRHMLNPSWTPCLLPMDTKAVMLTGAVSQRFQDCFFFIGNRHSPLPSTSIINLSPYPTSLGNCSMPHPWSREWETKGEQGSLALWVF